MSESYTVAGRLNFSTNAPEVLAQMVRGFEEADKLIRGLQESTRRLGTDFRELGQGSRGGLAKMIAQLEKLGGTKINGTFLTDMDKVRNVVRDAATAQAEMARSAVETARAWKDIAAAGGRSGRGGAGGRGSAAASLAGPWTPAMRDAYPDAQWENADHDARSRTGTRRNAVADAAAASRYADDHALAMRENADMDARSRAAAKQSRVSHGHGMDAAMGAQMGGDVGTSMLERGFHAYGEVQIQQVLTQADTRITDAVLAQANKKIVDLQKLYPALTQAEGLTLFRNGMGLIGDKDEALEMLPSAVRLQQLYQLAPAGRGGSGGSEVQAAEKAGDIMQQFVNPETHKLDSKLYDQWMDFQARSYLAGGGLVDAKNWLAFARTSRTAGIGLSPKALEEGQALLEISPGRTGTALNSAFQVFGASTKHMTKATHKAWNTAKLLDPKTGDIIDQKLYQSDPFEWVWKDLVPKLAAQGIKTRDQILKWLTDNGQRGTVSGLIADVAIGEVPIKNTMTRLESQDPNAVDKLVNSDLGKLAALQASETNFFVALGKFGEGPGLMLLDKLTGALNRLTSLANDHPQAAANLITIGGGLAILAKAGGDAALAIYLGAPLVKGMAALATSVLPFGKGGVAAAALETLTSRSGLLGIAMGIEALGAATGKFPAWLVHGLSGAAVGGAIAGAPGAIVGGLGGSFYGAIQQGPRAGATLGDDPMEMLPGGFTRESYTTRGGSGLKATNAAYLQPANNNRLIQVTSITQLNGREIARTVTKHQEHAASRDPSGITGFDPRQTMTPPGQINA